MKQFPLKYLFMLLILLGLASCNDRGEDAPHPALLYNICDVADATDGQTVFHLYRPDADEPIVLTASNFSVANEEGQLPDAGTSGMLAYIPANGKPYQNDEVDATYWAPINNLTLKIPEEDQAEEYLADWDAEAVEYLAGWRGGSKLYLRLRLPYSAVPRRFGLVADPSTLSQPIPTLYLCHERRDETPTFDRQYYFAFDIAEVWNLPTTQGICVKVNNRLDAGNQEFMFIKNSGIK